MRRIRMSKIKLLALGSESGYVSLIIREYGETNSICTKCKYKNGGLCYHYAMDNSTLNNVFNKFHRYYETLCESINYIVKSANKSDSDVIGAHDCIVEVINAYPSMYIVNYVRRLNKKSKKPRTFKEASKP